ncbi:MAG TPA: hypothetical protein VN648_28160, partial [Candidatus Methylomirabilis sp.]|nr:hypothetical protein [Candidatus Methylomirabilis sp.]
MRDWVNTNYPGTRIAITEYNWGALGDLNGALAQADILGIFGREQLDLACLWGPAGDGDPWAYAYRIYRNYDGAGGSFGDVSVASSSADPDKLAIYAAQGNADGSLTLVVINKTAADLTSTMYLSGFTPTGPAKVYAYSTENLKSIVQKPDQQIIGTGFSTTFPAYSITTLVIPSTPAATASASLIFAHFVAGGGFSTAFTLMNTGDSTANGILTLTGQDGQPLDVTLSDASSPPVAMLSRQAGPPKQNLVTNTYPISLAPGATTVVTASRTGASDARSGWAYLNATGGSLSGVAAFQLAHGALPSTIAGVLSSHLTDSAVMPVDSSGSAGRYAGFAIANPGTTDVHITVSAIRTDGSVVRLVQPAELYPLPARQQAAKFLHQ